MPRGEAAEEQKQYRETINTIKITQIYDIHRAFRLLPCWQLVPGTDQFLEETGTSRSSSISFQSCSSLRALSNADLKSLGSASPTSCLCWDPDHASREAAEEQKQYRETINTIKITQIYDIHRAFRSLPCWQLVPGSDQFLEETGTSRPDEIGTDGFSSSILAGTIFRGHVAAAHKGSGGGGL
ncbi:hypothetical protein F511_26926 [Dorcoceras hygrometricum]|uniref:Uncharacterized protein n=1 Tax=Dorcoceras hygrometricum TaxID=472368 RepID=A0A2Z7BQ86_9LAMI|nr:hypothetical protein F511_26926 [Dorcoceras hygrometricum]